MKVYRVELLKKHLGRIVASYKVSPWLDNEYKSKMLRECAILPFGPYCGESWPDEYSVNVFLNTQQKNPHEDADWCYCPMFSHDTKNLNWRAGALSLEDLKEWFGNSIDFLDENGFIISVYEVDKKFVESDSISQQLRFLADHAHFVEQFSITRLKHI